MKTYTIDLLNQPTVTALATTFLNLTGYPKWCTVALDEWIALVTVSPNYKAPVHFAAVETATFELVVKNGADPQVATLLHKLVKMVAVVNKRSLQLVNAPILRLRIV